jgi:phosphoenolpyruvate carboxykinase (GTP)
VPIDAFLFGGRRASTVPLVTEAFDWEHGTFLGATMSVETTAAAAGEVGKLRFDPMAMLPFCGYNMADYFGHWLQMARTHDAQKLPRVFLVNWFRKDDDGNFIWPGFGDNSRVLEWICRRCDGEGETVETPIGLVPAEGQLDTEGLDISADQMAELLRVDRELLDGQLPQVKEHLARFGDRLPDEVQAQLDALERRVGD